MAATPVFKQEFENFIRELESNSKSKKAAFIGRIQLQNANHTPEELLESVQRLMKVCSDKRMRKWYSKSCGPVIETIKDYTNVIDTIVSAYPMPTALIWGGLKIVLECAGRHSQQLEKIRCHIDTLQDYLWDLSHCEMLYSTSPYSADVVKRMISRSYTTILNFWYRCTKIIEHPMRYVAVTDHKLVAILEALKRNSEELNRICERAEALLNQDLRKDFAEESVKAALERSANQLNREQAEIDRIEAARERQKAEIERGLAQKSRELAEAEHKKAEEERLAAQAARESAEIHRQNEDNWQKEQDRKHTEQRMQSLVDRIEGDNEFSNALLDYSTSMRHPETCEWLLQHRKFTTWSKTKTNRPLFWLHGKHGAGKSFLCSSAIDHMRGSPDEQPVAFQFLTKDNYVSRNQLLRNIAQQLLKALLSRNTGLPDSLVPFLSINKDSSKSIEKLIRAVLLELPRTYIFVDGLDEADYIEKRGEVTVRHIKDEVALFVNFLANEAIQHPENVRLWCSSQFSPQIQVYLCKNRQESIVQMSLKTKHTAEDIQKYLFSAIPESTQNKDAFASAMIAATIATEVEGSFLWANSMLEDIRLKTEDSDDLVKLAEEGLPTTLNDQYATIMERIKQRDRGDKDPPLWKIVLSLLGWAKRPLRMSEVIEAVAMTRTSTNLDLNESKRVDADKVLTSCMSLVRFIRSKSDTTGNGILRLSHSAVGVFLSKYADTAENCTPENQLVNSMIIRDCCLKYLLQPRYSRLLQKNNDGAFFSQDGEAVNTQHLMLYAAKYWHQHCDTTNPSEQEKEEVEGFLRSPNFLTCIQIQSLFVIGHFVQSFDPITDKCKSTKRTLPLWMKDSELFPQYFDYTTEWGELLHCGLYSKFNGEIDRCFWAALGHNNFLAKTEGRYQSFCLQDIDGDGKVCRVQKLSMDGQILTICWVQVEKDINTLHLETWSIDGEKDPQLENRCVQEFSADDVQWSLYYLPSSRSWPLIPNAMRVDRPDAFSLLHGGEMLRVGSKLITSAFNDGSSNPLAFPSKTIVDGAWEEARVLRDYLVVCRRRVPRSETSAEDQKREQRRIQMVNERRDGSSAGIEATRAAQAKKPTEEAVADESEGESVGLDSVSNSSDEESDQNDGMSSPSESWSEGSEEEQPSGNDTFSECSARPASRVSTFSLKSVSLDGDSTSLMSDISDSGFDEDSEIESDASSGGPSETEHITAEDNDAPAYPVEITQYLREPFCDWCYTECRVTGRWYQCLKCFDGDFDLCHDCIRRGQWCIDKSHQLYEIIYNGKSQISVGVHSSTSFKIRQELKVYDNASTAPKLVYHFSMKYDTMLYESPPEIHPQRNLVVWPLSGSQLLFADFGANNYFEQKIKTSSSKSRPICVSLSFSPCGNFLRVATVDSTVERKPKEKRKSTARPPRPTFCLNLHIIILELAAMKPTRSPPKLIASTSLRLGCGLNPHVKQLPFNFHWGPSELHFTVSSSRLRVYRINVSGNINPLGPASTPKLPFPAPKEPPVQLDDCNVCQLPPPTRTNTGSKPEMLSVRVPRETIFLPRSSRNRSVQFIPPHTRKGNSTVLIGPQNDNRPTAPIAIYLSENDLGGWMDVAVKEGEESRIGGQLQRLEGRYESFDEEQDCDIIFL